MRMLTGAVLTALVFAVPAFADQTTDAIDELVAKLGHRRYGEREAAMLALAKHGEAALPALRAAQKSADAETRNRASLLVRRIEERLEEARLLAGTKVRLVFQDVPVLAAVDAFAAKVGIKIDVEGDRVGLRDRKITLDTGETTFWEAFHLFCAKAGLCERQAPAATPMGAYSDLMGRGFGGKINLNGEFNYTADSGKQPQPIALANGKAAPTPTTAHGAVRFQAISVAAPDKNAAPPQVRGTLVDPNSTYVVVSDQQPRNPPDAIGFHLYVTPEPTMPWQSAVSLRVTHAVDDQGQTLVQPEPYLVEPWFDPLFGMDIAVWGGPDQYFGIANQDYRHLVARFVPGPKQSRLLKEVRGMVTAKVLSTRTLATVPDVLAAAGKEFLSTDGTNFKVQSVQRQGRDLTVTFVLAPDPDKEPGELVRGQKMQIFKNKNGTLAMGATPTATDFILQDANGKLQPPAACEGFLAENGRGGVEIGYTVKFKLADATGAVGSLTFNGPRVVTLDIPFTLRDVPLCDDPQVPMIPVIRVLTK